MGTQRACAAAAALRGQLYVCGGETGTSGLNDFVALDTAERFNPRAGRWENLPRMSEPRGKDANGEPSVVACALADCLYVRGGHEIDSMERFDAQLGRWEALPPMWTPRYYAVMIACNSRLYVCGRSSASTQSRRGGKSCLRCTVDAPMQALQPPLATCTCAEAGSTRMVPRRRRCDASSATVWRGTAGKFCRR
eukprot:TRINITY_DN22580_c0_g1_i2.p2 TRINITY_DN22580_c0_g1~~TRINITY_DN22580_c0_g1_i2.p2  ORF type:complete len:194 (+),score=18.82 TRINITY_DN22580_c0_g1_i2:797-1378(+)